MLEFILLGAVFAYIKFNRFIKNSFESGSLIAHGKQQSSGSNNIMATPSVPALFAFSRKEFLMVNMYQYVFALFTLVVMVYAISLFDFAQHLWKSGNYVKYGLVDTVLSKSTLYRGFSRNNGALKQKVAGSFVLSLVANYVLVYALIAFRGGEFEKDIRRTRVDHNIVLMCSLFVHFITYLII